MIKINEKMKSISEINTKIPCGVQMTFDNGNTISIQFGFANYSSNRDESKSEATSVEVAMWNKNDVWHDFGTDEVSGWCSMDEVAEHISFCKNNVW
jgi:hypothetical protein